MKEPLFKQYVNCKMIINTFVSQPSGHAGPAGRAGLKTERFKKVVAKSFVKLQQILGTRK
jgi:hypothetical protein